MYKNILVIIWCFYCVEMLCKEYDFYYCGLILLDVYKMVVIENVQKDKMILYVFGFCLNYFDEKLVYFCYDYCEICCDVCKKIVYKNCEDVVIIEEVVNVLKSIKEIYIFFQMLKFINV